MCVCLVSSFIFTTPVVHLLSSVAWPSKEPIYQLSACRSPGDEPQDTPIFQLTRPHALFRVDPSGALFQTLSGNRTRPSKGIDIIALVMIVSAVMIDGNAVRCLGTRLNPF